MKKEEKEAIFNAQELVYDAWENDSAIEREKLAHKALSVDPLCAEAYLLLAEEADSLSLEIEYCKKGIKVFETRFDQRFFKQNTGDFWGIIETRPYIRLLYSLGEALWADGEDQQAIELYERILTLNEMDNQGVRYILINWLLIQRDLSKADALLKRYPEESVFMLYSELFLLIVSKADDNLINKAWQRANEVNSYVIEYLTFEKTMPDEMPECYQFGAESEAIIYCWGGFDVWLEDERIKARLKKLAGK